MEELLGRWKPATAANRYSSLQAFFRWAADEGEIRDSPMARMRKPRLPETPPPVLGEVELRAILAACEGQAFEDRRDMALIRTFIGTGARLSEIAGLRWTPDDETTNDVDLDVGIIRVMGKGRRERVVGVGAKAVRRSTDTSGCGRGIRTPRCPGSGCLGRGRLTDSGIAQAVRERGTAAGLRGIHAQFRHSYAHAMLAAGMHETDVMQLAGWAPEAGRRRPEAQ